MKVKKSMNINQQAMNVSIMMIVSVSLCSLSKRQTMNQSLESDGTSFTIEFALSLATQGTRLLYGWTITLERLSIWNRWINNLSTYSISIVDYSHNCVINVNI